VDSNGDLSQSIVTFGIGGYDKKINFKKKLSKTMKKSKDFK
jgi:hypothetical protein